MRYTLLSILLVVVVATTTLCLADQSIDVSQPALTDSLFAEKQIKQGFFYVRFAAAENNCTQPSSVLPGLGIGYRRLAGHGAADISISGIGRAEHRADRIFWTAPKASYVHYFQPAAKKSIYAGGGLAWGGTSHSNKGNFVGLMPSLTAGYEFAHNCPFLGFAECTVTQPAISVVKRGVFPGPVAEFAIGIGF